MLRHTIFFALITIAYSLECYEPGTKSIENNAICQCKYGYYGPTCSEINQCLAGAELVDVDCLFIISQMSPSTQGFDRCQRLKHSQVKVCDCPLGFGGETCEQITRDTLDTWLRVQQTSLDVFENVAPLKSVQFITSLSQCIAVFIYVMVKNVWKIVLMFVILAILTLVNRRPKKVFQPLPTFIKVRMPTLPPAYSTITLNENEEKKTEEVIFHKPRLHV